MPAYWFETQQAACRNDQHGSRTMRDAEITTRMGTYKRRVLVCDACGDPIHYDNEIVHLAEEDQ
jgi:hypothetical protein